MGVAVDSAAGGTAPSNESVPTCRKCGGSLPGGENFAGYCLACMLEPALDKEEGAGVAKRFGHYELLTGEDGAPIELGRGAMGVSSKAYDVDLCYPVTLKVINERCLGDKSARLRFLREARPAAS
jgi:hypothetical protein